MSNINFRYPTRKDIVALENVTLRLDPGKLVALVGLSGSGKSTLVTLLQRLYDPDSGQVCPLPLLPCCWLPSCSCPVVCCGGRLYNPDSGQVCPLPALAQHAMLSFGFVIAVRDASMTLTRVRSAPSCSCPPFHAVSGFVFALGEGQIFVTQVQG